MNRWLDLEKRVTKIEERNRKVEVDKAWEQSITRRISIVLFTYTVILAYLLFIHVSRPYLSAIIPTLGFLLSTLTLPLLKKIWIRYRQ